MNDLKTAEDNKGQRESFENITLICPKCEAQKTIKVPTKVITQSRKLITIGIPVGLICDHSFQAYIDKYSDVRGYQVVDFLIPKTEFYQSEIQKDDQEDTKVVRKPLDESPALAKNQGGPEPEQFNIEKASAPERAPSPVLAEATPDWDFSTISLNKSPQISGKLRFAAYCNK